MAAPKIFCSTLEILVPHMSFGMTTFYGQSTVTHNVHAFCRRCGITRDTQYSFGDTFDADPHEYIAGNIRCHCDAVIKLTTVPRPVYPWYEPHVGVMVSTMRRGRTEFQLCEIEEIVYLCAWRLRPVSHDGIGDPFVVTYLDIVLGNYAFMEPNEAQLAHVVKVRRREAEVRTSPWWNPEE